MMLLLTFILAFALGFLLLRLLSRGQINNCLMMALALTLGLGIIGQIAFYTHILLGLQWPYMGTLICLGLIGLLYKLNSKHPINFKKEFALSKGDAIGILLLLLLGIPLIMQATYYPLGGWDAWSCWNLKAKFIYLGGDNWKNMLDPQLWRSNTHYPLQLPLTNVFAWDLMGKADPLAPMSLSITFTLLCAAILFGSIKEFTPHLWLAFWLCLSLFSTYYVATMAISQYSDILLGLYLLSAVSCLLLAQKKKNTSLEYLALIFIGLLSFTKTEGAVAALVLTLIYSWQNKKSLKLKSFFILGLAALPTIIFTLNLAPHNEAFTNGLLSSTKPSDMSRLMVIAAYPFIELLNGSWNGLWLLAFALLIVCGKNAWDKKIGWIPLLVGSYLLVVLAYYQVNTFFAITWWLQNTFARIIFALIPTVFLWIALSLPQPATKSS